MAHPRKQPDNRTDAQSDSAHSKVRGALIGGSVYTGVIIAIDTIKECYQVQIDAHGAILTDCAWAMSHITSLLGFRVTSFPTIGTKVLLVYGKPSWIVGTVASTPTDGLNGTNMKRTGVEASRHKMASAAPDPTGESSTNFSGATSYTDLFEGEYDISNALGVGLTFLTTIMKMSAGDRAAVECHLLNDMVRIISENFQHFSTFGNFQIYNDGGLNCRWDGTSLEHESFGQLNPTDAKIPEKNREVDFENIDSVNATGRWRFSQFVGWMGNFINAWITDPEDAIGQIGTSALRSGKARVHVGNDGTILVQSVADIVLERVVRIIVPVEKKRWDDPTGVKKADFSALDLDKLKSWDFGPKYKENMFEAVFQIREYARALGNYHTLSRFHQMAAKGQEWMIPSENDTPKPDYRNKEKDVEKANPENRYVDAYACYRIMRDGSLLMMGAFGESITMFRGNIHVAASRHLTIESAGDMRFIAGQSMFFKAGRSVELSAITGSIALKCRTIFQALCEWGPIWLKSDMKDPSKTGYSAPSPAPGDPPIVAADNAIFLDASQGRTLIRSDRTLTLETTGTPDRTDPDDVSASIVLQSVTQSIFAQAAKNVKILSLNGWIGLWSGKDIAMRAQKCLVKVQKFFDINKKVRITNRSADFETIKANSIHATKALAGPKRPHEAPKPPEEQGAAVGKHYNHVSIVSDNNKPVLSDPSDPEELETMETLEDRSEPLPPSFPTKKSAPIWNFPEGNFYLWSLKPEDALYQTSAQQFIKSMNAVEDPPQWEEAASETLKDAPRTPAANPWPGKGATTRVAEGGTLLHVPSTQLPGALAQTPMTTRADIKFYHLKKS
jgi:hypothetical protein